MSVAFQVPSSWRTCTAAVRARASASTTTVVSAMPRGPNTSSRQYASSVRPDAASTTSPAQSSEVL
jgi:hypothetical protein